MKIEKRVTEEKWTNRGRAVRLPRPHAGADIAIDRTPAFWSAARRTSTTTWDWPSRVTAAYILAPHLFD